MIEIERPPVASPPFRRLVVAALITAVVVAAACEPRAPGAGGATDVSWHFSPDLSIGSLDSGGPDQFTRIAFVWADDMDRIWVGDALSYEVRVFDDEGRHVRSIGRHGAGPREFGAVQSIERGPRGDVWLADPSNRRWNVVDTAGRFVGGHPYASRMYAFGDRWGRDALLYTHLSPNTLGNLDFRMVRRRLRDSVLVPVDTIPTPSIGFGESTHVSFERDGRRMTMMIPVPFQATGMRLLLPGEGWWVGVPGDEYYVVKLDLSGDTLVRIRRPSDPVPVTEADLTRALSRIGIENMDLSAVPTHHPPFAQLWTLPDGHLLVRRAAADGQVVDVFTDDGGFVTTVPLPHGAALDVHHVTDDAIYGVVSDELGVPAAVRLRIDRP